MKDLEEALNLIKVQNKELKVQNKELKETNNLIKELYENKNICIEDRIIFIVGSFYIYGAVTKYLNKSI